MTKRKNTMAISAHAQAHLDAIRRSTEGPRPTPPAQPLPGHSQPIATAMDNITIEPILFTAREIHPQGPFAAVCVDIVDLGMKVKEFQGKTKAVHSCAIVFSTGRTSKEGYALDLSQELTVGLGDRHQMKAFLESWRGVEFTEAEKGSSFSLASFMQKPALISVVHKKSKDGKKTYANIGAIMPLAEGMKVPDVSGYKRAPFWEERKKKYADEFAAFMSAPPKDSEAPF